MRASLAYYTEQFGPYQFRELSIVEFPRYAAFARAHPHTITFSEGSAFLTRIDSGDVDRTFFVVAHETAHQWWGGQVIPLGVPGAGMVSETLAQYSSMMVLETAYGPEMARRFYDYTMDGYLRRRGVFADGTAGQGGPGAPLYLKQHRIRSGKGTITVVVARRPARAGVDPYRKLIERERDDNVKAVGGDAAKRGG
jgi:hypothetical protein